MSKTTLRAAGTIMSLLAAALPCGTGRGDAGSAARGERVFQRCFSCHSVDPEEKAKLQGPSLYKIVGRPAARIAGFEYSEAMQRMAAAGLVWDVATLDRYLADPEAVVAGTNMSIAPLRDEQERADLLVYLAQLGAHRP